MRTRIFMIVIVMLLALTSWLGVRVYRTNQQLTRAERYAVSGYLSWRMVCDRIAGELAVPHSRDAPAIMRIAQFCVEEEKETEFSKLVVVGDIASAAAWIQRRLDTHQLPLTVGADSVGSNSFPAGYN